MRKYRGLYIDNAIYHSEQEIDTALERMAVEAVKKAVKIFSRNPSMEASVYVSEKESRLVREFGWTWGQVEDLEMEAMA